MKSQSDKFCLKDVGITYENIRVSGNARNSFDAVILEKVLQMELTDLRCLYNGLGITGVSGLSIDSLQCVMLWMYLTGRAKYYGLSKTGVVEYTMRKGGRKWEGRSSTILHDEDSYGIETRLAGVLKLTPDQAWICKYAAETLIRGEKSEKLMFLKRVLMNTRKDPPRKDYALIIPYLRNTELRDKHGTRVVFDTKTFLNMLDVIRICMRHAYRGAAPSDYIIAMKSSEAFKEKFIGKLPDSVKKFFPIINLARPDTESAKLFLNSIRLD